MMLRFDIRSSVASLAARLAGLGACLLLSCGFQFSNAYYSPRNPERDLRHETRYIILHTTEAPGGSALMTLRDLGEANFCVDTDGRVYRIIDHRRTAFHCGRSMWEGHVNIDDYAIGIEVVGYHNRDITAAQYQALAALLAELKLLYRVPDERVLTHSMVAYGAPNKWIARNHRGRKRCGMLFALPNVRQKLHLKAQPRFDPDVRAGRLINGDPYLANVLYGNIHSLQAEPSGTKTAETTHAPSAENVQTIGVDGASAGAIAGTEAWNGTTLYIFRGGSFLRGSQVPANLRAKLPAGTRVLVGFAAGGPIDSARRAYEICGARWRLPDTFYLFRGGELKSGSEVSGGKISQGTMVFYRN